MKITWMLTCEAYPDTNLQPGPDFTAFDGEEVIGRVYQIEDGPGRGFWGWSMTAVRPGVTPAFRTSGRTAERGPAARCMVDAYRSLLALRGEQNP